MKLIFKLETVGYMMAVFSINEQTFKICHSSDYGDKFQELLNKFFLIYEMVELKIERRFPIIEEVLWQDDLIDYKWSLNMNSPDSSVIIKITEQSPTNDDYNEEILNEKIDLNKLFNNIYSSLNELFVDFGFWGYKINWEVGNFPIYEYIKLKADKENKKLDPIIDSIGDEWRHKINIEDEIKIFKY